MVLYLFNNRMDSTAKLTWLALIAVAPLLGAFLLLYTQTNVGHRTTRERVAELINETKDLLPQDAGTMRRLEEERSVVEDMYT